MVSRSFSRIGLVISFIVLAGITTAPQESLPPDLPLHDGVYYSRGTNKISLGKITVSDIRTARLYRAFVPGLTPSVFHVFKGSQSPDQLNEGRPTFFVRKQGGWTGEKIFLLKLDAKRRSRELQVLNGVTAVSFKPGFPRRRMVDLSLNTLSSDVISITPSHALSPGEYLITTGVAGAEGFDFGIASALQISN
jgi:hypothetical protein